MTPDMLFFSIGFLLPFLTSFSGENKDPETIISKWPDGKKGAITLTYDDGSINQFRKAMPIMDSLGLPGTFYIVTGELEGSKNKPKFIGRPVEEIIEETAAVPTNEDNFFERASAVGYLGFEGTLSYHFQAGTLYEQGRIDEAYRVIDEAYELVRYGEFPEGRDVSNEAAETAENSWEDFRRYAARGHEFGSHAITHPRLAVLDEANLLYELEGSRADVLEQLGEEHVFSAEGPFGTEDERVMEYMYEIYPAIRNRMPHDFLAELNRGNKTDPTTLNKEYVQWQRGPLTDVPMTTMKEWVDKTAENGNIWLVLVFHGVDGIGWEPRTSEELSEYFHYIEEKNDNVWVATFKDVTKYIRQRMDAEINQKVTENKISISLTHTLDKNLYDFPLTMETILPAGWEDVTVRQDGEVLESEVKENDKGKVVRYKAMPNQGEIQIDPS
jgi:peptidoglycan/xylan/chitin deacetylase (PgdA/CDA1 family)